ncbi:MAG: DUF808 domain-containing protein [Rhizobiales bacterium]|nr:DUF808 domain-containing protein [Hyphomicrobiales bacterium]
MGGLLSLLDDVAAIARLAAAQVDDIAAKAAKVGVKVAGGVIDDAAKAGAKTAGVVIDDAAVTPAYVQGLPAAREVPIVAKIARASLFNKLVILLPLAMILNAFAPWLLIPLLMLGGAYLCFEGAEKIWHSVTSTKHHEKNEQHGNVEHLERERVAGAIKTDFILSAEIMTIALSEIDSGSVWGTGFVLAIVALGITALVYGSVIILVKADDLGLKLSQIGRLNVTRALGRGIVKQMPNVLTTISIIGTAAMLWVGGSIIIHELKVLGLTSFAYAIDSAAGTSARWFGFAPELAGWLTKAALDGLFGLVVGLLLIPIVQFMIIPLLARLDRVRKLVIPSATSP